MVATAQPRNLGRPDPTLSSSSSSSSPITCSRLLSNDETSPIAAAPEHSSNIYPSSHQYSYSPKTNNPTSHSGEDSSSPSSTSNPTQIGDNYSYFPQTTNPTSQIGDNYSYSPKAYNPTSQTGNKYASNPLIKSESNSLIKSESPISSAFVMLLSGGLWSLIGSKMSPHRTAMSWRTSSVFLLLILSCVAVNSGML